MGNKIISYAEQKRQIRDNSLKHTGTDYPVFSAKRPTVGNEKGRKMARCLKKRQRPSFPAFQFPVGGQHNYLVRQTKTSNPR